MKRKSRKTNKKAAESMVLTAAHQLANIKEKAMTMNSTTSELMQDNSNELIFGQKHNDIDCALCPTAKRACDRAWVTAKQIENWSGMPKKTLWRWLEKLEKARRIASVSDMTQTPILDSAGVPHETTLYNLNVPRQRAVAHEHLRCAPVSKMGV